MSLDGIPLDLDDRDGPAKKRAPEALETDVASILAAWEAERTAAPSSAGQSTRARAGFRRWPAGQAAAAGLVAGLLLAGSVAAALYVATRKAAEPGPAAARPAVTQPAPQAQSEPAPVAPDLEPVSEADPPEKVAAQSAPDPASARPARRRKARRRGAGRPSARQLRDQLARANVLRRERAYAQAAALYARVAQGGGQSAYAAAVAAGELELEHLDRPARARRHFMRARRLQPKGALDLSALWGLANAAKRLGDTRAERRALEAVQRRYPASQAATRAAERLR